MGNELSWVFFGVIAVASFLVLQDMNNQHQASLEYEAVSCYDSKDSVVIGQVCWGVVDKYMDFGDQVTVALLVVVLILSSVASTLLFLNYFFGEVSI